MKKVLLILLFITSISYSQNLEELKKEIKESVEKEVLITFLKAKKLQKKIN